MENITLLTIILSVVSITLSITALIYGWIMYRNTSKLQMQANATLEEISKRVQVVVEYSTKLVEKAWDFVTTGGTKLLEKKYEPEMENYEKRDSKIIKKTTKKLTEALKNSGLKSTQPVIEKVEETVSEGVKKTKEILKRRQYISRFDGIKEEVIEKATQNGITIDSNNFWGEIIKSEIAKKIQDKLGITIAELLLDLSDDYKLVTDEKKEMDSFWLRKIDGRIGAANVELNQVKFREYIKSFTTKQKD